MPNLNKVFLMGNLTRTPDVRYTPKGTAVAEFDIAINNSWTDQDKQKHEEVTYVSVTFLGRMAEVAGEYLAKGRPVFVEGRLKLEQWDDKQTGAKRQKLKVIGQVLQLIGAKTAQEPTPEPEPEPAFAAARQDPKPLLPGQDPDDDDIPF